MSGTKLSAEYVLNFSPIVFCLELWAYSLSSSLKINVLDGDSYLTFN